jgi:hypothetical protein
MQRSAIAALSLVEVCHARDDCREPIAMAVELLLADPLGEMDARDGAAQNALGNRSGWE